MAAMKTAKMASRIGTGTASAVFSPMASWKKEKRQQQAGRGERRDPSAIVGMLTAIGKHCLGVAWALRMRQLRTVGRKQRPAPQTNVATMAAASLRIESWQLCLLCLCAVSLTPVSFCFTQLRKSSRTRAEAVTTRAKVRQARQRQACLCPAAVPVPLLPLLIVVRTGWACRRAPPRWWHRGLHEQSRGTEEQGSRDE